MVSKSKKSKQSADWCAYAFCVSDDGSGYSLCALIDLSRINKIDPSPGKIAFIVTAPTYTVARALYHAWLDGGALHGKTMEVHTDIPSYRADSLANPSFIGCEHANEMPSECPCSNDCVCKKTCCR